jgi:peroxiredoxin
MKRNICLVLISISIFLVAQDVPASALSTLWASKKEEARPAPDFTLESLKGDSVTLSHFKGKGVILFFFTTWCPYCREKFPGLSRSYEADKRDGIELLAINEGESRQKISSFVSKENVPFDIFLDSDMKAAQDYGVLGIPTFALINKEGMLVYEGQEIPSDYKELLQ